MAFVPMLLRRAAASSSATLPPAIRAFGSPRTFQSAVSTILSSEKQGINRASSGFPSLLLRFSTAAVGKPTVDENLIRALKSGIEAAEPAKVEGVPDGCPFDVRDDYVKRKVVLERKFGGEEITISIDLSKIEDIGEANIPSSIPLFANILKPDCRQALGLTITAFPHELTIETIAVADGIAHGGRGLYFCELDSETQKAFYKYVEARGLEPSTMSFLFQYVANRGKRDWFNCVSKVKKFVEED